MYFPYKPFGLSSWKMQMVAWNFMFKKIGDIEPRFLVFMIGIMFKKV